jgi:caprin-1
MPSVCKNSEKLPGSEMETPYKACISAIEKKLRNLEKRKGKLDGYRDKLAKGEKLDKDQKEAVSKYETVVASLEFARELQKQFQTMSDEADKQTEKLSKKQAKREKLERQQLEIERLSEILRLQCLLDNLGTDDVRTDLQSGKYDSLTLTEENLTQLDEFYQLIAPSVEGENSFAAQLTSSSEHLISYLDRLDKPIVNTSYRELHELVDRIAQCKFFDAVASQASSAAAITSEPTDTLEGMTATDDNVTAAAESETEKTDEPTETEEPEPLETETVSAAVTEPSAAAMSKSEVGCEAQFEMVTLSESLVTPASTVQSSAVLGMTWYQQAPAAVPLPAVGSLNAGPVNPAATRQQRPLQEIVSSLQGSYNFLQDSEIDVESSFDRMSYAASQEPAYAYMSQQVVQQSGVDLHHYPATVAATTYPNGSYVPPHHHQEPSYVVVGHDPTSGELQYAYAGNQPGYMPPVMTMSSTPDVAAVQQTTLAGSNLPQSKVVPQPLESAAKLGGGDTTEGMVPSVVQQQNILHQNVPEQHGTHQVYESSTGHGYGAGSQGYRGGRGGSYGGGYSGAARGPSRGGPYGGNMAPSGRGSSGYRGGKSR